MSSKRPRSPENNHEQAIQLYSPAIKKPENSLVKFNNLNSPVIVFAHGAGASSSSEWMIRWKKLLVNALNAVEVVTFDYPYINGRRKAAPKPEKLVGFHSDIVRNVAARYPEHPLVLVGKSLGSRISCMVAAESDIRVSAVVCLGYPLKARNGVIRDEPLLQLTVPIMFVQGSNDGFCPLQSLELVRKKLKPLNALHVIENGDHSFQIAKKNLELTGITHEKAEERAVEAVAIFLSRIRGEKVADGPNAQIMVGGASSMKMQYPPWGPTGRGQLGNRAETALFSPLIGRKVKTRWPDDNNFYEAVITDYNAVEGRHALVYDQFTANETWEWVNLAEISPEDIQWVGEDPGIPHKGGYGRSSHGMNRGVGRDGGPGGGRGRGMTKGLIRKDFPPSQNGIGKKAPDDIQLLHTDALIKEVERVFGSSNPDPLEIEKAKKVLKEHEQALADAIARLADISDGESDEGGRYMRGQPMDRA